MLHVCVCVSVRAGLWVLPLPGQPTGSRWAETSQSTNQCETYWRIQASAVCDNRAEYWMRLSQKRGIRRHSAARTHTTTGTRVFIVSSYVLHSVTCHRKAIEAQGSLLSAVQWLIGSLHIIPPMMATYRGRKIYLNVILLKDNMLVLRKIVPSNGRVYGEVSRYNYSSKEKSPEKHGPEKKKRWIPIMQSWVNMLREIQNNNLNNITPYECGWMFGRGEAVNHHQGLNVEGMNNVSNIKRLWVSGKVLYEIDAFILHLSNFRNMNNVTLIWVNALIIIILVLFYIMN